MDKELIDELRIKVNYYRNDRTRYTCHALIFALDELGFPDNKIIQISNIYNAILIQSNKFRYPLPGIRSLYFKNKIDDFNKEIFRNELLETLYKQLEDL